MDLLHITLVIDVILAIALAVVLFCLVKSANSAKLLKKQLDSAVEANDRRIRFFSGMVHDLKMPLSIILGAAQLIEMKLENSGHGMETKDGRGDEIAANGCIPGSGNADGEYIGKNIFAIKSNCYRMMRLTNNLLDLAKSEAGHLVLKPVNCDLCVLLEEIVRTVRPYAVIKQIDLRFSRIHDSIIASVDIEKTERMMLNLLSNAIRFTGPGGTVIVAVHATEGRISISVKDTGIGIPAERQSRIFGLYQQAGLDPRAEKEGCGIGLYLVKTFVELHHGNIRVISEEGKGSEFIIELPAVTVRTTRGIQDTNDHGIIAGDTKSAGLSGGHPVNS